MGWLIVISGIDGSGKTTLVNSLRERFGDSGISVNPIRVRLGFTPFVEWIKKVFRVRESNNPITEYSSSHFSRYKNFPEKIIWHGYYLISLVELIFLFTWIYILRSYGRRIITDRFLWDNQIIYRSKYGKPNGLIKVLWSIAQAIAPEPDVTFFLCIPPEESYDRILIRNEGKEEECLSVLKRRAQMYDEMDKLGLVKIDALRSPENIVDLVCQELEDRKFIPKIGGQISKTDEKVKVP